ncbi:hypothetical protein CWO89_42240 [Bradyrhizobium sp. Leo170]|nr:hypothetical protein CWO89_42240 [Bradyrhizobium sp. Leo170]
MIQYAAASQSKTNASAILDRPVKPGDDSGVTTYAAAPMQSAITYRSGAGNSLGLARVNNSVKFSPIDLDRAASIPLSTPHIARLLSTALDCSDCLRRGQLLENPI